MELNNLPKTTQLETAIVGGGLAGMAAAMALCDKGLKVEIFEQRNNLGGRAGLCSESYNGQTIDLYQHVAMGCCTNFLDFCHNAGVEDCFQRYNTYQFIGPDGAQYDFSARKWLPAPFHLLPSLWRQKYLSWRDRWSIIRALRKLIRLQVSEDNERETIGSWLRKEGQSETALAWFWSVVLVGALSETIESASINAAKKVFVDGFCASRKAYELIMPREPLSDILDRRVSARLESQGVTIHRGVTVKNIIFQEKDRIRLVSQDGIERNYDAAIVAVPWFEASSLFSSISESSSMKIDSWKEIPAAAITSVHLWFDRPIMQLPQAAIIGKLSQWIFSGCFLNAQSSQFMSQRQGCQSDQSSQPLDKSYYYQVVISASHRLVKHSKEVLLQTVLNDLKAIFTDARLAKLLDSKILIMPRAVFSMQPGVDRLRPKQTTPVTNLFLAGDWTSTGWPGTMEGAVRSGYLAAKGLLKNLGY